MICRSDRSGFPLQNLVCRLRSGGSYEIVLEEPALDLLGSLFLHHRGPLLEPVVSLPPSSDITARMNLRPESRASRLFNVVGFRYSN